MMNFNPVHRSRGFNSFIVLGLLISMVCCKNSPKIDPLEKKKAEAEPAMSPVATPPSNPAAVGEVIDAGASIYNAKYSIIVTSLLGIEFCRGTISFKLNAAFGKEAKVFDIPAGKLKCVEGLVGDFDIAEAFGSLSSGGDQTEIIVKDSVMYLKGMSTQVYEKPYRPFVPSFIAAPKNALRSIMLEYRINARDTKTGKTDVGFVGMRTVKSGESYVAKELNYTFTDTMRFETINKGFSKLEKIGAFLFERFEILVSFKPLAVPHIILETKVRDLAAVAGKAKATSDILTLPAGPIGDVVKLVKVKIEAKMISLEGFKPGE